MTDNIKKTEVKKPEEPEVKSVILEASNRLSATDKPKKEKYTPEQKKIIAKIKADMKEKSITKTLHSEFGVIKIGGKK